MQIFLISYFLRNFMNPTTEGLDDILKKVLYSLLSAYPEVNAAIIASRDGLYIVSEFSKGLSVDNEKRVIAMLEAVFPLPEESMLELEKGTFEKLIIKSSDGYLTVLPFVSNDLLIVSTPEQMNEFDLDTITR